MCGGDRERRKERREGECRRGGCHVCEHTCTHTKQRRRRATTRTNHAAVQERCARSSPLGHRRGTSSIATDHHRYHESEHTHREGGEIDTHRCTHARSVSCRCTSLTGDLPRLDFCLLCFIFALVDVCGRVGKRGRWGRCACRSVDAVVVFCFHFVCLRVSHHYLRFFSRACLHNVRTQHIIDCLCSSFSFIGFGYWATRVAAPSGTHSSAHPHRGASHTHTHRAREKK